MDEQTRLPVLIDAGRTEVAVPAYSGTIPKDRWPKRSPWTDSAANQIAEHVSEPATRDRRTGWPESARVGPLTCHIFSIQRYQLNNM